MGIEGYCCEVGVLLGLLPVVLLAMFEQARTSRAMRANSIMLKGRAMVNMYRFLMGLELRFLTLLACAIMRQQAEAL